MERFIFHELLEEILTRLRSEETTRSSILARAIQLAKPIDSDLALNYPNAFALWGVLLQSEETYYWSSRLPEDDFEAPLPANPSPELMPLPLPTPEIADVQLPIWELPQSPSTPPHV